MSYSDIQIKCIPEEEVFVLRKILLSCPTLRNELEQAVKESGFSDPILFLPRQLHNDPKILKSYLQETIDRLENIDQILLCVSGCGGGTIRLRATNAELVIPRCRDCLDLLLSQKDGKLERPEKGIFVTQSWADYMLESEMSLEHMTQKLGKEQAEQKLREIYRGFERFYIIDTGVHDVEKVRMQMMPLVQVLHGTIFCVPGDYWILRKMVSGKIDEDFMVIPKGQTVKKEDFRKTLI